jgi:Prefoldin subunit
MVAYPIEEAKALLTEKLSSQRSSMTTCLEDLEFLREQITTMEVNIGTPRLRLMIDGSTDVQLGCEETEGGKGYQCGRWFR